jgi:hypothetical protein
MGKLAVGALRAVLVVVLAGTVLIQALMVWVLVIVVCVWRLVTMVRRGTVFSHAAFWYVDVVV